MEFREAYTYLEKLKRVKPLQSEYQQKVIARAKELKKEIEELRRAVETPVSESTDVKATVLERTVIEKLVKYLVARRKSHLLELEYRLGDIPEKEFVDADCEASNLLEDCINTAEMLLKERYSVVL